VQPCLPHGAGEAGSKALVARAPGQGDKSENNEAQLDAEDRESQDDKTLQRMPGDFFDNLAHKPERILVTLYAGEEADQQQGACRREDVDAECQPE